MEAIQTRPTDTRIPLEIKADEKLKEKGYAPNGQRFSDYRQNSIQRRFERKTMFSAPIVGSIVH